MLSENIEDTNNSDDGPIINNRASRLSKHPVVIVVSFDGFRYNYFQRADTPNMDIIRDSGVSVQYMRNQFVTKTFPNHMSIATGYAYTACVANLLDLANSQILTT